CLLSGTRSPRDAQSKGKLARLRARESDLSAAVRPVGAGGLLRSTSRQDEVRRDRKSKERSVARQSSARQRTPLQRQLSRSARLESFGGRNPARRRALQHVSRRALQRN